MKIVTVGADLGIEPGMTSWGSQYGVGRGSLSSVQFSSVTQLCLTLCNPTDCSMPGYPVHHQLLKLAQTHVHRVSDAIQLSHPLSFPSLPASKPVPASGSLPMSQFIPSSGQRIRVSALASVLPMNIQDWFSLGWTVWISCSPGTLKSLLQHHSSKASILRRSAFLIVQLSRPYMTTGKTIALSRRTFVGKVMSLLFNMLSRLVITCSKDQVSLNFMAAVNISSDFGAPQNKVSHCFHCFPIYFPWCDGTGRHDLSFLNAEFSANFFILFFHFHQEPL